MDANAAPVELPAQPVLSEKNFPRYRYINSRFHTADKETPLRMPLEADGFWMCDCGHPAKNGEPCSFCGDTLPALQEAFSQKTLETLQLAAVKERAAKRAAFSQKFYQDTLEKENQKLEEANHKIYQEALRIEKKGTSKSLRVAIKEWEKILDYSDAMDHLESCRKRLPELEEKEEADRIASEAAAKKAAEEAKQRAEEEKRRADEVAAAARKKRNTILGISFASLAVVIAAIIIVLKIIIPNSNYNKAVTLMESNDPGEAFLIFKKLGSYKDSADRVSQARSDGTLYQAAVKDYNLAKEDPSKWDQCLAVWGMLAPRHSIAAGFYHSVGLNVDGTVVATGDNQSEQCNTSSWSDVISVSAGSGHTVGLRADGTVVAIGNNDHAQCDVTGWQGIVAIAAGGYHTVGLRADGTVVAVGNNDYQQCDVSLWKDIVSIATGQTFTIGLTSDGEVVFAGGDDISKGGLKHKTFTAIAGGGMHVLALLEDGTVVAVGLNDDGQLKVSYWEDITYIAAGAAHSVGVHLDGTVTATGWNKNGQCDVSDWNNIVEVSASIAHTIGLQSDGTVVAVGFNDDGRCDVSDWIIQVPNN